MVKGRNFVKSAEPNYKDFKVNLINGNKCVKFID